MAGAGSQNNNQRQGKAEKIFEPFYPIILRVELKCPAGRHSAAAGTAMGFIDDAAQREVHILGFLCGHWINQFVRVMIHLAAALRANHLGILRSHLASCLTVESDIVAAVAQRLRHPNELV